MKKIIYQNIAFKIWEENLEEDGMALAIRVNDDKNTDELIGNVTHVTEMRDNLTKWINSQGVKQ